MLKQSCLLFLSVVTLVGCQDPNEPKGPEGSPTAIPVTVAIPINKSTVQWDAYSGRLSALETVELRSRVSGYLISTHFTEGEIVQKGQLLFVIDPRPYEAQLTQAQAAQAEAEAGYQQTLAAQNEADAQRRQAQAASELATAQLRRNEPLVASRAISQDEFDVLSSEAVQAEANLYAADAGIESAKAGVIAAQAAIETAKAQVEAAKLDLEYTRIIAPITGRIGEQLVNDGNLVSGGSMGGGSLLATIVSVDPIHCTFDANERALMKYIRLDAERDTEARVNRKPPVYLSLIDEEGFPHVGHLDFVDNQVNRSSGSIRAQAIFRNPKGVLTPGMFTKIRIPGSFQYDAILIPDSAVATDQASQYVFVIDENNEFSRRPIKTGEMKYGLRIVLEGLAADETIVVEGLQRLQYARDLKTVIPTETTIELGEGDGLPDEFEFIPRSEWISHTLSADAGGNVQ